ncbi:alpha/beta fold hydrolase [Halobiforma nitratireducens]|uniref:alpha/beta fold hydrolase n=1 Tax=Halobiforma nitratireducens TaxID=130048 RepID=UPI001268E4BA|nr:hypothetical protein [Halobiforma nitratireducens]
MTTTLGGKRRGPAGSAPGQRPEEPASSSRPTLVFGGERDPYFTAEIARETAARLTESELESPTEPASGPFLEGDGGR